MPAQQLGRRRVEELEDDAVGHRRGGEGGEHGAHVGVPAVAQIADEEDRRPGDGGELVHHRRDGVRPAQQRVAAGHEGREGFLRGAAGDAVPAAAAGREHRRDRVPPPAVERHAGPEVEAAQDRRHHHAEVDAVLVERPRCKGRAVDMDPAGVLPGEVGDALEAALARELAQQ